jgi:hypothetical protein
VSLQARTRPSFQAELDLRTAADEFVMLGMHSPINRYYSTDPLLQNLILSPNSSMLIIIRLINTLLVLPIPTGEVDKMILMCIDKQTAYPEPKESYVLFLRTS